MSTTTVFVIVIIAAALAVGSALVMRTRPSTTVGEPWQVIDVRIEVRKFLDAFQSAPHEDDLLNIVSS